MSNRAQPIAVQLEAIETEMKRLGYWSPKAPQPQAFENMGPFGINTLTFEQWLQFVLVPRVKELLKTDGPWPTQSQVSVQALRNFDGQPEADQLVRLLYEFDELFSAQP